MSIKYILLTALMVGGFYATTQAQPKPNVKMQNIATNIFNNWQKGEFGQGYADFKTFIDSANFKTFSHPLVGSYAGNAAFQKLSELITERETKPNALLFSNVVTYSSQNRFCFQFDSEGKVSGGYPYKGYNIIQLEIRNDKLIGFREYFGFIDPAWFK